MATVLNEGKITRSKNRLASQMQHAAMPAYREDAKGIQHPIVLSVDQLENARQVSAEAVAQNQTMLRQLDKNSTCRAYYQHELVQHQTFCNETESVMDSLLQRAKRK